MKPSGLFHRHPFLLVCSSLMSSSIFFLYIFYLFSVRRYECATRKQITWPTICPLYQGSVVYVTVYVVSNSRWYNKCCDTTSLRRTSQSLLKLYVDGKIEYPFRPKRYTLERHGVYLLFTQVALYLYSNASVFLQTVALRSVSSRWKSLKFLFSAVIYWVHWPRPIFFFFSNVCSGTLCVVLTVGCATMHWLHSQIKCSSLYSSTRTQFTCSLLLNLFNVFLFVRNLLSFICNLYRCESHWPW